MTSVVPSASIGIAGESHGREKDKCALMITHDMPPVTPTLHIRAQSVSIHHRAVAASA